MLKKKNKVLGGCLSAALALTTVLAPAQVMASNASVISHIENVAQNVRLGGVDRYETAAKITQQGWSQSEYAVLAAGMDANLVDAMTSAPLAKLKGAPILLTEGNDLTPVTEQELKRLGVKKVFLTTGTGVISQNVLDKLSALGIETIKLGGTDRFETSLNIAKELNNFKGVVVTTAWTNADALSIASIAAQEGMPILLTETNALPQNVANYIDSVKDKVQETYVLGGVGAVNDSVKNELSSAVRLGGTDRYETNQEIIKYFTKSLNLDKTYVTNGEDGHLVDALAGSPLAAQDSSPILLTQSSVTEETKEFFKLNLAPNIVALGGTGVVSDDTLNKLGEIEVYSVNGAVEGSTNTNAPVEVNENLVIKADNMKLQNANLKYSVWIQGDNVTLTNVDVAGTVFISGSNAKLDNVTYANKVVLNETHVGGGGGSVTKPKIQDNGFFDVDSNGNVVISASTFNDLSKLKDTKIQVSQASVLTFGVKKDGNQLNLVKWNLIKGENDLLSINNPMEFDYANCLTVLKDAGVTGQAVRDAVDFNGFMDALQNRSAADKLIDDQVIYGDGGIVNSLASAIDASTNRQAIYDSLNIPGVYSIAAANMDAGMKAAIKDALQPAVDSFADPNVTVEALVGADDVARENALRIIKNSDQSTQFFKNVNLASIFETLAKADTSMVSDISNAVNFNDVFDNVITGSNDAVNTSIANAFNKTLDLSAGTKTAIQDSITMTSLLTDIIGSVDSGSLNFDLSNLTGTQHTSYPVEIVLN